MEKKNKKTKRIVNKNAIFVLKRKQAKQNPLILCLPHIGIDTQENRFTEDFYKYRKAEVSTEVKKKNPPLSLK